MVEQEGKAAPKRILTCGRHCSRLRRAVISCGAWEAGLGTLFVGTSLSRYAAGAYDSGRSELAGLDFTRDASSPLAALPPQYCRQVRRVIYLHMAGAAEPVGNCIEHKPELKRPRMARIVPLLFWRASGSPSSAAFPNSWGRSTRSTRLDRAVNGFRTVFLI